MKFEQGINRQFKPDIHADDAEKELLERFKSNSMAKALLYVQMSFFRPAKAAQFLERACSLLKETEADVITSKPLTSELITAV